MYKQLQNIKGIIKLKETLETLGRMHCFLTPGDEVVLNSSFKYVIEQLLQELFLHEKPSLLFDFYLGEKTIIHACLVNDGVKIEKGRGLLYTHVIHVPFVLQLLEGNIRKDLDSVLKTRIDRKDSFADKVVDDTDILSNVRFVIKRNGFIHSNRPGDHANMYSVLDEGIDYAMAIMGKLDTALKDGNFDYAKEILAMFNQEGSKEGMTVVHELDVYVYYHGNGIKPYFKKSDTFVKFGIPSNHVVLDLNSKSLGACKLDWDALVKEKVSVVGDKLTYEPTSSESIFYIDEKYVANQSDFPEGMCEVITQYAVVVDEKLGYRCRDKNKRVLKSKNKVKVELSHLTTIEETRLQEVAKIYSSLEVILVDND